MINAVTLPASPRLKRHATHQAGRDVDVSFYYNQLGIIYSPHEPVYPPAINGDPASGLRQKSPLLRHAIEVKWR